MLSSYLSKDFDEADDEELQGLIEEEFTLRLEEEELLAIGKSNTHYLSF